MAETAVLFVQKSDQVELDRHQHSHQPCHHKHLVTTVSLVTGVNVSVYDYT